MEYFNIETQSHLLEVIEEPEKFILSYNKIIDNLNLIDAEYKNRYKNFDVSNFFDVRIIDKKIFFMINDNWKDYPDAHLLLTKLNVAIFSDLRPDTYHYK